jgi:hypothetical protein
VSQSRSGICLRMALLRGDRAKNIEVHVGGLSQARRVTVLAVNEVEAGSVVGVSPGVILKTVPPAILRRAVEVSVGALNQTSPSVPSRLILYDGAPCRG